MDGIIVVDKPAGMTSHDVVARVRRLTGLKRVGHAGTLDPMATGVLPILIGRATKVSDYLMRGAKSYEGTICFGLETDTLDITGQTITEVDAETLTEERVRAAARRLIGLIDQVPPKFSAIKVDGRALYKSARQGLEMPEPEPRRVEITAFELVDWRAGKRPTIDFRVTCSKGTYIRSLARDVGQAVGFPGTLSALRRTRSGAFEISGATSLDLLNADNLAEHVISIQAGLAGLPAITVETAKVGLVLNGGGLTLTHPLDDSPSGDIAVYGPAGETLAIHRLASPGLTKTVRVIGEGSL